MKNIPPENNDICPHCNIIQESVSVQAHHLPPGIVLQDRYIAGKVLGEGGFGITYIGHDINLDMRVAIKEYFPAGFVNRNHTFSETVTANIGPSEDFFEKGKDRFLKEARILAKFSAEPGIVCVRDFFSTNNTAYIIMEYLDGITMDKYLAQKGSLSMERVKELLLPVINTLEKVHSQGLIHRDISPDNLMLMDNNSVKLLDFGAARDISGDAAKSLSIVLKPGYAPEEQYRTKGNQGPWTDVYAICATIYKCITGISPDDSMQRVFNDEIKLPSELGAGITKDQEAVLMKGMAILHKSRIQNMNVLRKLLFEQTPVFDKPKNVEAQKESQQPLQPVYTPRPQPSQQPIQQPPRPVYTPQLQPKSPQPSQPQPQPSGSVYTPQPKSQPSQQPSYNPDQQYAHPQQVLAYQQYPYQQYNPSIKKSKKGLIIALASAITLIWVSIALYFFVILPANDNSVIAPTVNLYYSTHTNTQGGFSFSYDPSFGIPEDSYMESSIINTDNNSIIYAAKQDLYTDIDAITESYVISEYEEIGYSDINFTKFEKGTRSGNRTFLMSYTALIDNQYNSGQTVSLKVTEFYISVGNTTYFITCADTTTNRRYSTGNPSYFDDVINSFTIIDTY